DCGASQLLGTRALPLRPADFAAPPPIGRPGGLRRGAIDALEASHLDFFRRRLWRDVVVEDLGFGFLDVLIDDDADDDVLVAAKGTADSDAVAFANEAVGLRVLAVDLDLPALTGALGFRTRLEEACDVQPNVETDRVAHMRISILAFAFSVLTNVSVSACRFWSVR